VPLLYYSCPAIGGNSPASLLGTLVLGNADWLAALVMHQLAQPGAPICNYGFTVQLMDMKSTLWAYSAPESHLTYAAIADLARYYQLPTWGLEVQGDVPRIDAQVGAELQATTFFAFLAGVELVHNAGNMGAGKLAYPEAPLLVNEIISYTRPALNAIDIDDQDLGELVNLIDEVGPMGDYVSAEHTLKHFKDFWYPSLFRRSNFDPLDLSTGESLSDRLNSQVRALIDGHQPEPLSKDILSELAVLESLWEKRSR
jgi:trimethylamine--corrinoid protein Co-methyltransferase